MDHEFCSYIIETLYDQLPFVGAFATLDLDRARVGSYELNDALALVIPLRFTLHDTRRELLMRHAALLDVTEEEPAIERLMVWCDTWREAMHCATEQECEAVAQRHDISAHLPDTRHPLYHAWRRRRTILDICQQAIEEAFPQHNDIFEFTFVPSYKDDEGEQTRLASIHSPSPSWAPKPQPPYLALTARTIDFDPTTTPGSIRSIKECELKLPIELALTFQGKLDAFFRGWARAMGQMCEHPDVMFDPEASMPQDFFFPKTLALKKCVDTESFAQAHLAKSRLGKWTADT